MIWREAYPQDTTALIQLSREPMGGRVKLIWGFEALQAPTDCTDFASYVAEEDSRICGTACSWRWADGSRYLSGLRFNSGMRERPGPKFWKRAYEDMLGNENHAWTCIGEENTRARRILESGASWLPHYRARQHIRTWFVPLRSSSARRPNETEHSIELQTADWRHVAIASGTGISFWAGRALHQLGLPGVPLPGQRLNIAYLHPTAKHHTEDLRQLISTIHGYDGLVVVLLKDSEAAKNWEAACPCLTWTWDSTLYTVSWDAAALDVPLPNWKGLWL